MKRPGASTAATASGVGSSDISGAADSVADGVAAGAAVSESDAGREITTIARSAIPITAAIKTRGDVLCFGAALGFGAAGLTGAGVVLTFTRVALFAPPSGTGGITILLAEDDFFAVFLAAAFFLAGAFFATFFAAAFFLAGAFFATFFAADFFFAGDFLAAAFFAGAFLVTFFFATFLAAAFFLTATFKLLQD
jgi:hypothetical protein